MVKSDALTIEQIGKLIEVDISQAEWLVRSNFSLQTIKDTTARNVTQAMKDAAVVIEPARYMANIIFHGRTPRHYVAYAPTPEQALATSYRRAMEAQG